MIVAFISSALSKRELLESAAELDILMLNPNVVKSWGELWLAAALAKKAFIEKRNIAKSMRFEFLLWLTGTRDIKMALKKSTFTSNKHILLVSFDRRSRAKILRALKAKERKLTLKKRSDPIRLENISLSRI